MRLDMWANIIVNKRSYWVSLHWIFETLFFSKSGSKISLHHDFTYGNHYYRNVLTVYIHFKYVHMMTQHVRHECLQTAILPFFHFRDRPIYFTPLAINCNDEPQCNTQTRLGVIKLQNPFGLLNSLFPPAKLHLRV